MILLRSNPTEPLPREVRRWEWLAAIIAFTAVLLVLNLALLRGTAVPIWDADGWYAPHYILLADCARAGRFLLWNPWTDGGAPAAAEPQVGSFSPVTLIFGLVTGGRLAGFVLYWVSIWWLGGLGMLVLAKRLGAPAWGGLVVALGFAFGGFYTGHAEHTSSLYAFSFLPFLILRLDAALRERRLRPAVEAGALFGLSALASNPQVVFGNAAYLGLWALGRVLISAGDGAGRSRSRRLGDAGVVLAVVAAVGAVVLAPAYAAFLAESPGYTERAAALPRDVVTGSNALDPGALATFASPFLVTVHRLRADLWPATDVSSSGLYLGGLTIFLALAGLGLGTGAWRFWLLGVTVLALGVAVGGALPLRGWLYDLAPPSRYFRHAAIFRGYAQFTIAALALLGARALEARARPGRGHRLAVVAAAVLPGVIALGCYVHAVDSAPVSPLRGAADVHVIAIWLAVALVAGWCAWRPAAVGRPPLRFALCLIAAVDAVAAYRLTDTVEDTRPAAAEAWQRTDAQHQPGIDLIANGQPRVRSSGTDPAFDNRNLIAKKPVLRGYGTMINSYHRQWMESRLLVKSAIGEGRFSFAPAAPEVHISSATFAALRARAAAGDGLPVVVHSPESVRGMARSGEHLATDAAEAAAIAAAAPAIPLPVALEAYAPNELRMTVVAPEAGWLLVTDRWASGWRAAVNGRATPIWGADFLFRAVRVAPGQNRVELTYRPFGFPYLLILSWGTLVVVLALSLHARLRKPRGPVAYSPA